MAENAQNGPDCFPSKGPNDALPSPLSRAAIGSHLEGVYLKLGKRLAELFKADGQKLQQNRGRLSAAFDKIRAKASLPNRTKIEGELRTFGDLRLLRRQINEGINDALMTTAKGARLPEEIAEAIVTAFEDKCSQYRTLIGQQMLFDDAPANAPEDEPNRPLPMRADHRGERASETEVPKRVLQGSEKTVSAPAPEPLTPLKPEEILTASPALIVRYLDGINELSMGGLEDDVKPIIAKLGIAWSTYRHWRDNYEAIAIAAKLLGANQHEGRVGRLKQGVVQWVIRSVRMECNGDEQRMAERMEELGLASHYAYRSKTNEEDTPQRKERVRRTVEPVVDPRWKFLQHAPRKELPAEPAAKAKKVKRERDPRLLEADYQMLLLTRRLLKAVETDEPHPWLYAIGKLSASLEEKPETKLA